MKVTPLDKEYTVSPDLEIYSETDLRGAVTAVNDGFLEISGYEKSELMGKPHSIVRHPDMPKVVFKLLWETLNKHEKMSAIVKNLRKNGEYYWVYSEYEPILKGEEVVGFKSFRKPVPHSAVAAVESLYGRLLAEESTNGVQSAQNMLEIILIKQDAKSYKAYVDRLYEKELKGLFGKFFGKLFGRK